MFKLQPLLRLCTSTAAAASAAGAAVAASAAATGAAVATASSRAEMASASPLPTWVILGSIPRVCGTVDPSAASAAEGGGGGIPPGADLSFALKSPPRVSLLNIPRRIFPDATTPGNFPSVIAADPSSGLLLLHANQGCCKGPTVIDRPGHHEFMWREFVPGYFVLDVATAAAFPLPDPALVMHMGHMGLVSSPGGGYMVAELQPMYGADYAHLLCFSSDDGEWVTKKVNYPLSPRILAPNGAVSHHGRLWFVDLSWCLITCDPFAASPALRFVQLPPGKELKCGEVWGVLDKYRCVGVSAGKLRFVDMYQTNTTPHHGGSPPKIGVWTLADPDSDEWTLEHEASFPEIWADESYKATGLPKRIPVLALIHPKNPDVVYFFLEEHLFGVDVCARKVLECEVYELVAPPREALASRFIRAWELPRELSSGVEC